MFIKRPGLTHIPFRLISLTSYSATRSLPRPCSLLRYHLGSGFKRSATYRPVRESRAETLELHCVGCTCSAYTGRSHCHLFLLKPACCYSIYASSKCSLQGNTILSIAVGHSADTTHLVTRRALACRTLTMSMSSCRHLRAGKGTTPVLTKEPMGFPNPTLHGMDRRSFLRRISQRKRKAILWEFI